MFAFYWSDPRPAARPRNLAQTGTSPALLSSYYVRFATAERARLTLQLLGTIAILAWVPGNAAKLVAMLLVWSVGFGTVSRPELALMVGVNLLFICLNLGALRKGAFRFTSPDALGMPMYEFAMWGFYVLNTVRFLDGPPPATGRRAAWIMAAVFAVPFSITSDPAALTLLSGTVVAIALALYREPMDFAYAAYMAAMGALVEYVGVWTGQWSYPGHPPGGVPSWFIPMWAGVGLFTRRLLLPLVRRGAGSAVPG